MSDAHVIHLPPLRLGAPVASETAGTILFIGTATVLIRYGGITILTDPNFLHRGDRIHLGYGLHARRRTEPALSMDELPEIDVVLLSHMHEDHFDRLVSERLDRRLPIVTTGHAAAILRGRGFSAAHALSTWQALEVERGATRVRITSTPARHGPAFVQRLLPPTMGSIVDFERNGRRFRMYVSGDTLPFEGLHEIPRRFPDVDLALLHLGGTKVLGVVLTMDGPMGVEAMRLVRPERAIPIHYDDCDVFKSPLDEFRRAVDAAGLGDRVCYLERGETYTFHPRVVRPSRPSVERRASTASSPSLPG